MKFWRILVWLAITCFALLMALVIALATPAEKDSGLRAMPKIHTQ